MPADSAPAAFPAPLVLPPREVPPEWIDYNGHMNMAYYVMAFDQGIDRALDLLGIGESFAAEARMGPYTIQAHIHYLGELLRGESFEVAIRVLDCDAKRIHFFCEMRKAGAGEPCATLEEMLINVDLGTRRSVPYPDWAQARIAAMRDAHAGLERPPQAGAPLGIRRKG